MVLLLFVILLALIKCFLFFVPVKNFIRPKLIWPIFYRLKNLIFGRFMGNTTFTFPSAFFKIDCIFVFRFVEISFFSFFGLVGSCLLYRLSFFLRRLMREKSFCAPVCVCVL